MLNSFEAPTNRITLFKCIDKYHISTNESKLLVILHISMTLSKYVKLVKFVKIYYMLTICWSCYSS